MNRYPTKMAGTFEETYHLEKPQILPFLESEDGKCVMSSLQEQEGCVIKVMEIDTEDTSTRVNLSFLKQQITEVADDVIVSSVGSNLDMLTGQLSRCVLEAAGKEIGEECRKKCPTGLNVGGMVVTSGGRLKCKAIYHCCLPPWSNKQLSPEDVLKQVVSSCITTASTEGYKSIAFPALGSGNLGYPKYVTVASIVDTVREFCDVPLSLADVHVVGLQEDLDFEKAYKRYQHKVTASEDKSSETITIGKLRLVLLEGEITDDCSDVIVHPTTKQLSFDSGDVSATLRIKCGNGFVEECQAEARDMKEKGLFLSGAPGLLCTNILHTAPKHFGSWKKTVKKCIKHVDATDEYTSIAFPAVPADTFPGSPGDAYKKAAWEMVAAVTTLQTTTVTTIRVFCPNQSLLATYTEAVLRAIPDLCTKAGRLKSRIKALKRTPFTTKVPTEDGVLETPSSSVLKTMPATEHRSRNESAALVTVFCQENKCDVIFKKLSDRCDEDYSRIVADQRTLKLKSSQTEDLLVVAKKEGVAVDIVEDSGTVILKGPYNGLTKVSHHLDEMLQTVAEFGFVAYPICWEGVDTDQRVFCVAEGSREYICVKNNLMKSFGDKAKRVTILKIERIQLPHLYRQFQIERQTVQKEHPSQDNQRILWHGTDIEAVPNINKYGFNRSYSGKHASQYGQGVYFATSAIYSSDDKYSPPDTYGIKYIYQARVLTGRYTKGEATMRDAPLVNPTKSVRFNSTTDNASRPSLFSIFRDTYSYPEYLISFQLSV
ncbi:protein mono-ADP-ribosyltransferase PARP15-like isoform X1 [Haliotis rufescens]|uniref:protein mono-ADP-ribosyltransferase PARP15-like isoform X1 n=2 Tax=Haliotis rufescens TaxID=6454 RepID=UPI00201EC74B|nr:protein mono-ADP-ribosyltransferase PARP15-like isoform X1 [Haliotis rufescens]